MDSPTPAMVRAGAGFYYDEDGNPMALCCGCLGAIDLQHDGYYEVSRVWRHGVVGEGERWWWCGGCWEGAMG